VCELDRWFERSNDTAAGENMPGERNQNFGAFVGVNLGPNVMNWFLSEYNKK
jgi:hypothetical protein